MSVGQPSRIRAVGHVSIPTTGPNEGFAFFDINNGWDSGALPSATSLRVVGDPVGRFVLDLDDMTGGDMTIPDGLPLTDPASDPGNMMPFVQVDTIPGGSSFFDVQSSIEIDTTVVPNRPRLFISIFQIGTGGGYELDPVLADASFRVIMVSTQ